MFTVNDAHHRGVTAVAVTNDCRRIISGGGEGMIRVWQINSNSRELLATMKEHKNAVVAIRINKSDTECVTASLDGTCIIWNLKYVLQLLLIETETLLFQTIRSKPSSVRKHTLSMRGLPSGRVSYHHRWNGQKDRLLGSDQWGTDSRVGSIEKWNDQWT